MNDTELHELVDDKILTGGRQTSASNTREVLDQLIDDKQNIDGKNEPDGYCGLDSDGKIEADQLAVQTPSSTGAFLNDDGTRKKVERVRRLFSGDGIATDFVYTHNIGAAPSAVSVVPCSLRAAALFYVTHDASDITITFLAAPLAGVNNLAFDIILFE
jgi:hypothetical protein